jgi:hypothetical protein
MTSFAASNLITNTTVNVAAGAIDAGGQPGQSLAVVFGEAQIQFAPPFVVAFPQPPYVAGAPLGFSLPLAASLSNLRLTFQRLVFASGTPTDSFILRSTIYFTADQTSTTWVASGIVALTPATLIGSVAIGDSFAATDAIDTLFLGPGQRAMLLVDVVPNNFQTGGSFTTDVSLSFNVSGGIAVSFL